MTDLDNIDDDFLKGYNISAAEINIDSQTRE